MSTTIVFVLNGLKEDGEYGELGIHSILKISKSREVVERLRDELIKAGTLHNSAEIQARKFCFANKIPINTYNPEIMVVWNAAVNKEYNRILGTEGLNYWSERNRFFDGYEILEMPLD
jgi:hypothetical protein